MRARARLTGAREAGRRDVRRWAQPRKGQDVGPASGASKRLPQRGEAAEGTCGAGGKAGAEPVHAAETQSVAPVASSHLLWGQEPCLGLSGTRPPRTWAACPEATSTYHAWEGPGHQGLRLPCPGVWPSVACRRIVTERKGEGQKHRGNTQDGPWWSLTLIPSLVKSSPAAFSDRTQGCVRGEALLVTEGRSMRNRACPGEGYSASQPGGIHLPQTPRPQGTG